MAMGGNATPLGYNIAVPAVLKGGEWRERLSESPCARTTTTYCIPILGMH